MQVFPSMSLNEAFKSLFCRIAIFLTVLGSPLTAFGQHADILVDVDGVKLTTNSSTYLTDLRGGFVREGGVLEVSNPGYASARPGVFAPGDLLSFQMLGPLLYSIGTDWRVAVPEEYFRVFHPAIDGLSVTIASDTETQDGFPIGEADERGVIHEHVRFQLGRLDGDSPRAGAYALRQVVTMPDYDDSEAFLLIFNHGLATPEFIDAVVLGRQLVIDSRFDCSGDGLLTVEDIECVSSLEQRDRILTKAGESELGDPYRLGDTNLDGAVNSADLNVIGLNWQQNESGWYAGDFNLDGRVDASDLNYVGLNWLYSAQVTAVQVCEPNATNHLLIAIVLIFLKRKTPMGSKYDGRLPQAEGSLRGEISS